MFYVLRHYNKSSISTSLWFLLNLQKDVISTQKQPSCKKWYCTVLSKIASMKKVVKCRWWLRNGCDGRSVTKIFKATIQVNFVPIPSEAGLRQHKFSWIVGIKIFATDLPSQSFLGRHLYFTAFFILAILHRAAPFFTAWLFLIR